MSAEFVARLVRGDPESLAAAAVAALPRSGATLAIVYATEAAAPALPAIVERLAAERGIETAVGGVGLGICGGEGETYEEPAVAVLAAALPAESFRTIAPSADPAAELSRRHGDWIAAHAPAVALVHGDPRCRDLLDAAAALSAASGAFLVGGLLSHRAPRPLLARSPSEGGFGARGLAGLMLAQDVGVATALTQGCVPIGPVHRVEEARGNIVMAIDGRPGLAVLVEDIGPVLASDLERLGGVLFVGLPVRGSDTGDYLVRNLMAIDPERGWLVIGAEVAPGEPILFCRRDPESARRDMTRMVDQLARRLKAPPKAGIYVSCIARGAALFGEKGVETALIRERLGDFPLIGFFANGEISRDRLYGHTGVLALFV